MSEPETLKRLSMTEARSNFLSFPDFLADHHGTIAVSKRGKPVLAVMSWEMYESIIETLEIMSDKETMDILRKDIEARERGETVLTVSLEDVIQKASL